MAQTYLGRLLKAKLTSMSLTLLPSAGLPCTILGPSGHLLVPKASVGRCIDSVVV